jgi:hypothetical protein
MSSADQDEWFGLLDPLWDGSITPEQLARFEQRLAKDPAAREACVRHAELHMALRLHFLDQQPREESS